MGVQYSTLSELPNNELIKEFVGPSHIDRESSFWNRFLNFQFSMPITKSDNRLLKETVEKLCFSLAENNKTTINFTTLTGLAIFHTREILTDSEKINDIDLSKKCRNVLFIMRCCCEYFVEHHTEDELIANFNTLPLYEGQPTILDEFLLCLSELLAFLVVDETTYYIHLESVSIYLLLLCTRMFEGRVNSQSKLYQNIMKGKCSVNAVLVVRKLLHNYIKNDESPSPEQGIVGWAATGIWSLFGAQSNKKTNNDEDRLNPLANHSSLLLLVLTFHYMKDKNPYRDALFMCKPGSKSEPTVAEDDRSFPLNFKRLHKALARDLHSDQAILLLYLLLHKNPSYMKFTLGHKDLQSHLVPILEVLYNADHQNVHHIYMALIVVLIFTQEERFNTSIHEMFQRCDVPQEKGTSQDIDVKNQVVPLVPWYKERNVNGITLGSLLILIVLRTIQYNMAKMRDKYLHTNCLTSLANMASTFKNLHPTVTQKFLSSSHYVVYLWRFTGKGCYLRTSTSKFSLLNQLVKRHAKLSEKIKENAGNEEELSDLTVLEEIIHMMIEILNVCLTNKIEENSTLVYALVRDKEIFQNFRTHPKFQDVVENIDILLTYFGKRIDEKEDGADSADGVIDIIKQVTPDWPKTLMKKFPQLKFKYMEEDAAEEFFVPYIWSIVYRASFLYWNSEKITLFHVQP